MSAALGFGEDFFGSDQLTALVQQYTASRGLDQSTAQVEVTLRDGESFIASHVRVATGFVVFHTEQDEHVCVPHGEVVKVRIGPRTTPLGERQTGFSVGRVDERADRAS